MRVIFHGAARTVTGSMHMVEIGGKRILLDCGLYQGRRLEAFTRNSHFPFPVRSMTRRRPLTCPYRPLRQSAEPGQAGLPRRDLLHGGHP